MIIALENVEYSFWKSEQEWDYQQCIGELAFIAPAVHRFLDSEKITKDNLSDLLRIKNMCATVADFTQLQPKAKENKNMSSRWEFRGVKIDVSSLQNNNPLNMALIVREMQKRIIGLIKSKENEINPDIRHSRKSS